MEQEESRWFGFRTVTPAEKAGMVTSVFESVAPKYDIMNDMMSGGVHRLWKDAFVKQIAPKHGETILDLAGGTGDISLRMHRVAPKAGITLSDINPAMLAKGKDRLYDAGIANIPTMVIDAETIPFADNSLDCVTIAFGLRNVTHIDTALAEIFRVLKPGGRFYCLEFSTVTIAPLRRLYDAWSFHAIPKIGEIIAKDRDSYQYLVESIRKFPNQVALAKRMQQVGFTRTGWRNLSAGVAAIHYGFKD